MKEREALRLARQLLWRYRHETPIGNQPHMICQEVDEAFERIDEALAQPEQEPDVWLFQDGTWTTIKAMADDHPPAIPIYTTPPQRTWVGLTDEEIEKVWDSGVRAFPLLARELETKLKEKNGI